MSSHHTDPGNAHVSPASDRGGDLKDRRRAEHDFERATLLATVEELVKSIAHDVKQPLGALLMTARACQRGLTTGSLSRDQVCDGLDRIVSDSERISDILEQFRAATRVPSALPAATDINAVIRCALEDTAPNVELFGVAVATELADALPPVHADRQQLQHLVRSLIAQALRAMTDTAKSDRSLTLRSTVTAGGDVTVEVRDTGPSMPAGEAERLFEPSTITFRGTTGLELAVCRAIVEDHGGRIWTTACERGAVFSFALPGAEA
jgi:signal transduction histidine kinase